MASPSSVTRTMPNLGAALAITAGVVLLAATTWPTPGPQGASGDATATWAVASRGLGVVFLIAPCFVGRALGLVKGVLAVGAVALLVLTAIPTMAGGLGPLTVLDLIAAVLAGAAAFLIGPRQRTEVDRALRAERGETFTSDRTRHDGTTSRAA